MKPALRLKSHRVPTYRARQQEAHTAIIKASKPCAALLRFPSKPERDLCVMGAQSQVDGVGLVENVDGLSKSLLDNDDNLSSIEATYTSLIQQYLAVLCIDNATFLAERLVATSKSNHSYYLLAICHYRAGSPQRAHKVLEQAKSAPSPDMQYLSARCLFEMQQYGAAEEALLHECRTLFRQNTTKPHQDINDWILSTTVRIVE